MQFFSLFLWTDSSKNDQNYSEIMSIIQLFCVFSEKQIQNEHFFRIWSVFPANTDKTTQKQTIFVFFFTQNFSFSRKTVFFSSIKNTLADRDTGKRLILVGILAAVMEAFLEGIGQRLNSEFERTSLPIDEDLKRLYHNAFAQSAECFSRPGTMETASNCSENARKPIEAFQNFRSEALFGAEGKFKNCLGKCELHKGEITDAVRSCVDVCVEGTVADLKAASSSLQQYLRSHS